MLDDILEIALEVGGEVLEAVVEHRIGKRKKTKKERPVPPNREPWEQAQEKPPWEG